MIYPTDKRNAKCR